MLYVDTETLGLKGAPLLLIQTGHANEDPELHYVWDEPVQYSINLIEEIIREPVCIHNATYDSYHLIKWYNLCLKYPNKNDKPDPKIIRKIEPTVWQNSICIRPPSVTDTLLLLKQFGLPEINRFKTIYIRSVPKDAVETVWKELQEIEFPQLMNCKWSTKLAKKPGFVDIVLKCSPSLKLKHVYSVLFNDPKRELDIPGYMDIKGDSWNPHENDWLPKFEQWKNYFYNISLNKQYAADDILILDRLYQWLKPLIPEDYLDLNSELAWAVGVTRFRGLSIDRENTLRLIDEIENDQTIPSAPAQALNYLHGACSPIERVAIRSTGKKVLLACQNTKNEELSKRAKQIFEKRRLIKQKELLEKLAIAGRLFPDFNVSGAATNRMSGTGGLNVQGINRDPAIRELFTLADEGLTLCGGDFEGQEVTILAAVSDDSQLNKELLEGKDFHKLMASILWEKPYDDITKKERTPTKNGIFALVYGATIDKFASTVGVSLEKAQQFFETAGRIYPKFTGRLKEIERTYCSMVQPGGIGTKVVWKNPARTVSSLFGYSRDFSIPNSVAKRLFEFASSGITKTLLRENQTKIVRKDKTQTVLGATQSALYAAAFAIQAQNLRIAGNHGIQASGAYTTKFLQFCLWEIQPIGAHPWHSLSLNIHDEVLTVTSEPDRTPGIVKEAIHYLNQKVPLLKMDWRVDCENWKDVKG